MFIFISQEVSQVPKYYVQFKNTVITWLIVSLCGFYVLNGK